MCNPTAALLDFLVTEGGRGGRHPTVGRRSGMMYILTAVWPGGRVAHSAFFAPPNFSCLQFFARNNTYKMNHMYHIASTHPQMFHEVLHSKFNKYEIV